MLRPLFRDEHGGTAIEFALLGPVLVIMLFGLIETGRLLWTQHTLDEVAYATVRCMSISTECDDQTAQQDFAVARANSYGVRIAAADVVVQTNTTCKTFGSSNRVIIDKDFSSVMNKMVPSYPEEIEAEACFPNLAEAG
ncbi:TadE/TadG family type IV pilus assembly protein [Croceicoccus sp. Ery15]|uniref:TadE/TadG family type IV pilus assembly protein n=1 Tax=Croceicoccus sp. Ery15 TaxID=1703338 RepID=UPI001E50361B|nr:TadE/TadG family type IV pilus assembly protein [Croceicoccus sp. Ery15]